MDMIVNNPDKPWDWELISKNHITMDMIVNNPDKPWNWRFLAQNPNLDIDLIISTKDKYLD